MKKIGFVFLLIGVVLLLTACSGRNKTREGDDDAGHEDRALAVAAMQQGSCGSCHIIPKVGQADLLRALRGLPRHAAQRRHRPGPDPDLTMPKGHGRAGGDHLQRHARRHARLGQAGLYDPGANRGDGQIPADRAAHAARNVAGADEGLLEVSFRPDQRPTQPQTERDWENYFIVTLRDAGQVAVIDGDTYEVVACRQRLCRAHHAHVGHRALCLRDRPRRQAGADRPVDGKARQGGRGADLCYDARSVEVSKYEGELGDFTDKYAIVGCYWPPHFVMLDGQTLEPFKVVSTRSYTYDTDEYHPEPRVAAILASHFKPEWIVNVKETGQVWMVDYTDPINPTIKMIEAERFLHDGGWDAQALLPGGGQQLQPRRRDRCAGRATGGAGGYPGGSAPGARGQLDRPEFGPVWSTAHLGDPGWSRLAPTRKATPTQPGKRCAIRRCPAQAACSSRPTPTASGSGWI
jgi:hypothetical protein